MPCGISIYSIVRRLVLAASVYLLWQERNRRAFTNEKRDRKELLKTIINTTRFKLVSLNVKPSKQVDQVADRWQVQMEKVKDKKSVIKDWIAE